MPRSPPPEQSYLFQIGRCEPSYGVGIARTNREQGRLAEYYQPQFVCDCLSPKKFKGQQIRATIIGDRDLNAREVRGLTSIGSLTLRGKTCSYLGSLPMDMLSHVVTGVILGSYRYIYMSGTPLSRGHSDITSLHFDFDFEPGDFPDATG
jgi:hypothetical protein